MAQPGTIGVGYNTIRFDDEVTRFTCSGATSSTRMRREWQNQCGRWDLLDVVRLAYALAARRGHGLAQERRRLAQLQARRPDEAPTVCSTNRRTMRCRMCEPPSRWRACCASTTPSCSTFALALHKKERVAAELRLPTDVQNAAAVSARVGHVPGGARLPGGDVAARQRIPTNKNEIIAWDLAHDPS
jgi:exodeoxyribonuclease-1